MAQWLRALSAVPNNWVISSGPTTVILISGGLMPSSGLGGHQTHIWYTDIHVGKTLYT